MHARRRSRRSRRRLYSSSSVSGEPMSGHDQFERMFRDFIAGRLSRRDLMAAAGVARAATTLAVSGVAGRARRTRSALAQDATPKAGGGLKMGMQSYPGSLDPMLQP